MPATVLALALGVPCGAPSRAATPKGLPASFVAALREADVPLDAVVAAVRPLDGRSTTRRLSWRPDAPVNPASVMKLLTTFAALDTLGPAWTWSTPVWLGGRVGADGLLDGDLTIRGSGDPQLVQERAWLLLHRVRALGVRTIGGDLVIDRSAFAPPDADPAEFDGQPLRPYNAGPDALLLNYASLQLTFTPDAAHGTARITAEPPLEGVGVTGGGARVASTGDLPAEVPLGSEPLYGDWHALLGADFSDPALLRFAGHYPAACGTRSWAIAPPDPGRFAERLLLGLWREMGGSLRGQVREGAAPRGPPSFTLESPPLGAVVRDLNKYSNNVMAQQLFLTLGAVWGGGLGTPEAARDGLRRWAASRLGAEATAELVIDNGSGLSRHGRVTARLLLRLLQVAWAGAVMPELLASLPVAGVDGTLASEAVARAPSAHLKTGSLRDVGALAGVVLAKSGRRYALVAIVNHPNANRPEARAALMSLVRWTAEDRP